jgi:PIN domain nuclease of toxin-antitoxin system
MKYLLDTHAWVWWQAKPKNLSARARNLIEDKKRYSEMLLSAISVWEFCKLLEKERIGISCDPNEWLSEALKMPKLRLVPLSPAIAYKSTCLPQPFHDDPADQIIVATAREENATIITKDSLIREYKQVRTMW